VFREHRSFGPYEFRFIGEIQPVVDQTGKILEYNYELPTGVRTNRYGWGPFVNSNWIVQEQRPVYMRSLFKMFSNTSENAKTRSIGLDLAVMVTLRRVIVITTDKRLTPK
jgi:hypothetical protein